MFLLVLSFATYLRRHLPLLSVAAGLALIAPQVAQVQAAVSGKCVNCHTMHYSQDGKVLREWGNAGPYKALLTTDCAGCHMGVNTGGGTPFVMSATAPIYGATGTETNTNTLAGGNFYWVASGEPLKGHNVSGLTSADPYLLTPPGFDGSRAAADGSIPGNGSWPAGQQVACAGVYGCHGSHSKTSMEAAIFGGHHKGLGGALTDPGTAAAKGFRMLIGIAGYEDPEWELTPTSSAHNQYKGADKNADRSAISSLCMRCHTNFHGDGNNSWFKHPSDYDLGNSSPGNEVRGYGGPNHLYRTDVPVASIKVNTPASQVSFQDDTIITCVTCHRSHGSPYDKMMRWDYVNTNDGCIACHASAAGSYSESAHGDKQSGVKRLDSATRVTGSCAHCHDRQAVPYGSNLERQSLFAPTFNRNQKTGPYRQEDLFCFSCHTTAGSLQAAGAVTGNYDYSRNFGGLTSGGPESILDAFNQPTGGMDASYHNLYDIWKYAQKFSSFGISSSPCSICHNSHRAKRNRAHVTDPGFTAISLPADRESLWGDQADETMARYAGRYQPPLAARATGGYEPGGVTAAFADGSQIPDYNSFCLSCHNEPVYSTSLQRQTVRIDWSSQGGDAPFAGDKHGMNAFTQTLHAVAPYNDPNHKAADYLLACSDCHEPHGSSNAHLIRRGVNGSTLGGAVNANASSTTMGYLCRQCHADDYAVSGAVDSHLINSWEVIHHSATDRPYPPGDSSKCATCHETGGSPQPIGCGFCHGHGRYVDAAHPGVLPNGKQISAPEGGGRKTF